MVMVICWVKLDHPLVGDGDVGDGPRYPKKIQKNPTAFQKRSDKISKPPAHYRASSPLCNFNACRLLDRKQLESGIPYPCGLCRLPFQ